MASKRRLRRKTCERKKRYVSKEECVKVMREVNSKNSFSERLSAYKCKLCNGWHFGHTPMKIINIINSKL